MSVSVTPVPDDAPAADLAAAPGTSVFARVPQPSPAQVAALQNFAMATGPSQIAERIMESLEAADASVAGLPGRVAAAVLLALGSSAVEQEEVARQIARLFRDDILGAVEVAVHRALVSLSAHPAAKSLGHLCRQLSDQ